MKYTFPDRTHRRAPLGARPLARVYGTIPGIRSVAIEREARLGRGRDATAANARHSPPVRLAATVSDAVTRRAHRREGSDLPKSFRKMIRQSLIGDHNKFHLQFLVCNCGQNKTLYERGASIRPSTASLPVFIPLRPLNYSLCAIVFVTIN